MEAIHSFLKKSVFHKKLHYTFEELQKEEVVYLVALDDYPLSFPLYGTRRLLFGEEHEHYREQVFVKLIRLLEHSFVEGHRIVISGLKANRDAACLAAGFLLSLREASSIQEAALMLSELDPAIRPDWFTSEFWLETVMQ
ncbi:hypothetical protein [Alkalicoccus halolimnae]|uniref:Uncharacterized protein n=1 Tax=Alkalicoccus halolimnae TaxID=1667239 RepID=A0A5C7F2C6_9BACI|nr:hypothetical protein [Alkalicoccus halolimnae]TXF84295.1 hypothetical protein FTX54_11115 [Alkalicoccus halolimnae]